MRDLLLFLATAGLTLALLDRVLPVGGEDVTRVKLAAFAERAHEVDVLVLGSSQSLRGFVPAVFDARTRAAGYPTCSFNLGVPGSPMAETCKRLEEVAARRPANLRWVLIEAENIARTKTWNDYLTEKSIAWHDLQTTWHLWPLFGDLAESTWEGYGARWRSLVALAYHLAGTGRGVPWVEAAIGTGITAEERARWRGPRGDGCTLMDEDGGPGIAARRADFLDRKREFQRQLRRLSSHHAELGRPVESALPFFERMEELVRAMGARPVFFTIRRGYSGCESHVLARAGRIGDLLHFDDVERYPELYDVEYTFDGKHFDRAGARIFTEYFADQFLELVEGAPR